MTWPVFVPGSAASRSLAVLLLVVVLGGLFLLAFEAWTERLAEAKAQANAAELLRTRLETALDRQRSFPSGPSPSLQGRLLSGPTSAQRLALMQRLVAERAAAAGATLTSVEPLAAAALPQGEVIRLRIQATGTTETLQKLLHGIERGPTLLLIPALQVRSRGVPGQATAAPVDLEMELVGFAETRG